MTELTHSYSSIKMFENCPLRYYEQRIKKSVVDPGGEASKHGERIHKFIEDRLRTNQLLPQEMATYEPLVKSVEQLAEGNNLFVEHEVTINKSMQPTGWWDADAWLRSKLDILIVHGEGSTKALVMDWKTGKRRADPFQLQLFAAQVFTHFPTVQEVKTTLVWLKENALDSNQYRRSQAPALWEDTLSRIARIEAADSKNVWPAKPSGLCNYCPCKQFCDYAKR